MNATHTLTLKFISIQLEALHQIEVLAFVTVLFHCICVLPHIQGGSVSWKVQCAECTPPHDQKIVLTTALDRSMN
jgi:hypothetical protein